MTTHVDRLETESIGSTEYTFYPTVRRGHRPTSAFDGSAAAGDAGSLDVVLTVRGRGPDGTDTETANISLRTYGPGDIVGVDRRQIVRREPAAGTTEFPPSQFPHVEFDRPDLPWLFSPRRADERGRNRPWLSLVCVERDRDTVRLDPPGAGSLPVLETPVEELQNPKESWAWAHAQVTGAHDPDVEFARRSNRTVSRLLCPRNLDASTAYLACLVPTFEAGRRAGLPASSAPDDQDARALAWEPGADGTVLLPVYDSWTFRTGPDGDFESLVRELEPVELGPGVGFRIVDVGDPGPTALAIPDVEQSIVSLGGALKSASARGWAYPEDRRETLRTLLNEPEAIEEATGDPVIGPPKYGRWYAGSATIEPPPSGSQDDDASYPTWFHTLNTDPRYRLAASLGAETVRERQEALVEAAWEQFGEVRELNVRLRGMQLGRDAVASEYADLQEVGAGALLEFTAPLHDQIPVSTAGSSDTIEEGVGSADAVALTAFLEHTALPSGATSASFRRITRTNGPLARRAAADFDGERVVEALATDSAPGPSLEALDERVQSDQAPTEEDPIAVEEPIDRGPPEEEADVATTEEERPDGPAAETEPDGAEEAARRERDAAREVRFLPDERMLTATEAESEPAPEERDLEDDTAAAVAEAVDWLRSTTERCLEARARALALRVALQRGGPRAQAAAIARHAREDPTLVDDCEAILSESLPDLERSLTPLVDPPRPEAVAEELTPAHLEKLLGEFRGTLETLVATVTDAASRLRAGDEDVAAVLADADELFATLREPLEALDGSLEAPTAVESSTAVSQAAPEDAVQAAGARDETAPAEAPSASTRQRSTAGGVASLELEAVREGLPAQLDPEAGLAGLAATITGLEELVEQADPVEEKLATPTFPTPMFRSLADLHPEHLLPGVGDVPRNAVGALVTNPQFVEAYMVGLNHEMARELAWRQFPTDRRGTYFRQFWERAGTPGGGASDVADVDPLDEWGGDDLGKNGPGRRPEDDADDGGAAESIVLLVRGEVLRRYPETTIYAAKAVEDDGDRVPALPNTHMAGSGPTTDRDGARTAADADVVYPSFRGTLDPDVVFLGFDLSVEEAVSGPFHAGGPMEGASHNEQDEGWFFVLEEAPGEPRFGLDEDRGDVGSTPNGITYTRNGRTDTELLSEDEAERGEEVGWSALSWGHLVPDGADDGGDDAVAEVSHVRVAESRPGRERWSVDAGRRYHETEDREWTTADAAEWGHNAAHMARITWQQPVRMAIHADDLLPDPDQSIRESMDDQPVREEMDDQSAREEMNDAADRSDRS